MTPPELLNKLTSYRGPCMRLCAYCPEDINTAEVKECIEEMIRRMYKAEMNFDTLMQDYLALRAAYRAATGEDYQGEKKDENH